MEKCYLNRCFRNAAAGIAVCALIASAVPVSGQTVRTEGGVQIISNPKKPVPPKGVPSTPVLTEDLVIGAAAGDENYMFSLLRIVQADAEGKIYALDFKEKLIKIFDKNGKHLRTFGKKGQGPGEFQTPTRMVITPDNRILINDYGNKRIAFYATTGECLKEIPIGLVTPAFVCADSSGRIYGDTVLFDPAANILRLIRFDDRMNPETTIAEIKTKRDPRGFSSLQTVFYFGLLKNDSIVWCQTDKYEFTVVDKSGRTVRRISRDWDPVPLRKKEEEEKLKQDFGGNIPEGFKFVFPDHYPPIASFITDDEGRIYVRTYEDAGTGRVSIDVFDAEGRYVAKFSLPSEESLAAIRKGKVYCRIMENADGIPQIKRYSLAWQ